MTSRVVDAAPVAGSADRSLLAGARRIVVVRAITEAPDPAAAAASLLGALDG